MKSNKNFESEPTVGINFENIPPVGTENRSSQWRIPIEVPKVSTTRTNGQIQEELKTPNEIREKTVIKGFGETTLFTLGLMVTSKESGDRIRLDDVNKQQTRLCNAESICRRNPTVVRKYYKEMETSENQDRSCETDKNDHVPVDFQDEIFASDFATKKGKFG
jgi:hypothetical protein